MRVVVDDVEPLQNAHADTRTSGGTREDAPGLSRRSCHDVRQVRAENVETGESEDVGVHGAAQTVTGHDVFSRWITAEEAVVLGKGSE